MSGIKGMGWSPYKKKRRRVLKFLLSEYNRLMHEAVFDEDFKKLDQYKECVDLIEAMDGATAYHYAVCPVCGSNVWLSADVPPLMFKQFRGTRHKKEKSLKIAFCKDCGFYYITGW